MQQTFERLGLQTVETMRVEAGMRIAGNAQLISRASLSRAGGVSDLQVWRALDGRASPRVVTAAKAAHGLLARILQETNEKDFILPETFSGRVDAAAQAVAYELNATMATPNDGNAKRRLRARLDTLEALVSDTMQDHFRVAKAMTILAREWLSEPTNNGVKMGAMGAAIAIVNARPIPKSERDAEAAHAS